MLTPTVIPYRVWQAADGRRASTAGALPWRTPAERDRDGWQAVQHGFTVQWPDGTTGGMPGGPWGTVEEAEAAIASRDPFTAATLHAALARLEAAGIDAKWVLQPLPGGCGTYAGCQPIILAAGKAIGTPIELDWLFAQVAADADAEVGNETHVADIRRELGVTR